MPGKGKPRRRAQVGTSKSRRAYDATLVGSPQPPNLDAKPTRVDLLQPDLEHLPPEERRRRRELERLTHPLGPLGALQVRWALKLARDPLRRQRLRQRLALHERAVRRRHAQDRSKRELFREADIFQQIIVGVWSRLGFAHTTAGSKNRRRRTQRVRIERVGCQEERLYYKVLTTRRTMLGWKNALPYKVSAGDLISESTLFELSVACQRRVTAYHEDRRGVWVIVDRLEGVSGLPTMVRFPAMFEHFPDAHKPVGDRRPVICLGVREHRKISFADLEDHPHILVGGESGGGKSNFVNNLICSLIARQSPDHIRLILVDLKRVEFSMYAGVPHLAGEVLTQPEEVVAVLGSLVALIDRRMRRLEGKARKLSDWNRRYPGDPMPRVLLVIDEFAQLMLGQPKEITDLVVSLLSQVTNLGRAAGVHALVCTQRPAIQVVPANVKYNMPLRIAGSVSTATDSMTILGVGDAAALDDVPGRMVVKSGRHRFVVQTPLVTDGDIAQCVRYARTLPDPVPLELPEPKVPLIYNRTALLREVVDPEGALGGVLAAARLVEAFGGEGMSRAMASNLVAWCRNEEARTGAVVIDGQPYLLLPERNYFRLQPVEPDVVAALTETVPPVFGSPKVETLAEGLPVEDLAAEAVEEDGDLPTVDPEGQDDRREGLLEAWRAIRARRVSLLET